jgi:hypothetical protein
MFFELSNNGFQEKLKYVVIKQHKPDRLFVFQHCFIKVVSYVFKLKFYTINVLLS